MENPDPRIAIVTGGSSGIGAATMEALVGKGRKVFNADIHPSTSGKFIHCDITRAADVQNLFNEVGKHGAPDYLILCAGIGIHERLHEGDPEKWRHLLDTNIMGNLRMIRAFAPAMMEQGRGHIVIIGSVASQKCYPYGGVYAASKAALATIAETLRLELMPHVKTTIIHPGSVETHFFENMNQKSPSTSNASGIITAQTVASAIVYALDAPAEAAANEIVIRPISQEF